MSRRTSPPLPLRPEPSSEVGRATSGRRGLFLPFTLSAAAHLGVFAALWPHAAPPPAEPPSLVVSLVDVPKPEPLKPPGPPGPAKAAEADPGPPQPVVRPKPVRPSAPVQVAEAAPAPDTSDVLSESQLVGASRVEEGGGGGAGQGGGGGGCDTARAIQQALRGDPLVHIAVAGADRMGKAVMLWNGDWVQSGAQEGKGLSAVREAIMWEVAFIPEACREQPMHGMVLLSLADGSTRFAIGSGEWRWSDLLGIRRRPLAR